MRILILGINYPPEKIGIAVYTGDLARALADAGHEVRVVTAKPYYPEWRVAPNYRRALWWRDVDAGVRLLRCPMYVPRRPNGTGRLVHHASFALSVLVPMLWNGLRRRPDAILCVAPSIISAPVGWLTARMSGALAWLHIQDFEIDAAVATGLIGGEAQGAGRLIRLAKRVERALLRRFDRVSSISEEMCRRLVDLGVAPDRVRQMRNWADLANVQPLSTPSVYRAEWNIAAPHVALYSGNIANKQGIEIVVEAAQRLARRRDLVFVICGQGPNRAALAQIASGSPNIIFRDLQPKERLSELLALATVHLLPQNADAADLVLPSKLTNMLASGRPVVATAAPGTGLAREVDGCGMVTPPGDAERFAHAIETLIDQPVLRERFGDAARARAERDWNKDNIVTAFCADLAAAAAGDVLASDGLR